MDEEEVMRRASLAVKEARKAVADAEKSLVRTQNFLKENGLSVERLREYLEKNCGPDVFREIEKMAEQTMREARQEAEQAISEMRGETKTVSKQRRTFKKFI